jgi:predicted RNase H-like HicB family nuclease
MPPKSYRVDIERDEAGWWVATVRGIAGVHTQAKSLAQLRQRTREALEAAEPLARQSGLIFPTES